MPADSNSRVPVFSTARERRLWLWTAALVATIYLTLGWTSRLAGVIPDRLATAGFLFAMFLIGITILTQGLKVRPRGFEIGVALGIAVVYFMAFFRLTIPERSHLIEYGVVAVFVYEALSERASHGRRVPRPAVFAILTTSLVGVIDECIQKILPSRVFELEDILFNVLAAVMAVFASAVLAWARRRRSRAG